MGGNGFPSGTDEGECQIGRAGAARFVSVTDVGIFRGCWERKFRKRFMDESSETSRSQGFKTFFLLEI